MAHHMAHLVIGTAFNIEGLRDTGRYTRKFVTGGTIVTVEQLLAHAPERITRRVTGYGVDKHGALVEMQELYFDGSQQFARQESTLSPTLESRVALIHAMMKGKAPSARNPEEIVAYRPGTPNATRAINQWKKAQMLEHKSGIDLDVENRYYALIKRVVEKSLKSVPLDITDPAQLDAFIPKRVLRDALVNPRLRSQLSDIDRQAPDAIAVTSEEGATKDLAVTWKRGIGYITIPRDLKLSVRREDFAALRENRDVKLRVANGRYLPFDAIFDLLDEQREAQAAKQARREEYRVAAARRDPTKPTRNELRSAATDEIEVWLRAAKERLSKHVPKGQPQRIRKSGIRQKAEKLRKQHQGVGQVALAQ
jgi:hypothetical protein